MNLSSIFEILDGMSAIGRYSQTHLVRPESNLEHIGFVAMMSEFIANEMNKDGHEINMDILFTKAIIHDTDEIATGDIPRPTKYFNTDIKREIDRVSAMCMENISIDICGDLYYFDAWETAKDGREGVIVAVADTMSVLWKATMEIKGHGNITMKKNIGDLVDSFSFLRERADNEFNGNSGPLQKILCDAIMMAGELNKLER